MVTVSRAAKRDCRAIRRLEERVWSRHVVGPYAVAPLVRFGHVFVAKERGALIGAIIAMRTNAHEVYIDDWVVEKGFRNRGIGLRLYRALLREIGNAPVVCFVNASNRASLSAHRQLGFALRERVKDPFCVGKKGYHFLLRREGPGACQFPGPTRPRGRSPSPPGGGTPRRRTRG